MQAEASSSTISLREERSDVRHLAHAGPERAVVGFARAGVQYAREQTLAVVIRFDGSPRTDIDQVTIARQIPESSYRFLSLALATVNDGSLDIDPNMWLTCAFW